MLEGTVKFYNEEKGYGFIRLKDRREIFVHVKDLKQTGVKKLGTGDEVTCDISETDRGPRCVKVKVVRAAVVAAPVAK